MFYLALRPIYSGIGCCCAYNTSNRRANATDDSINHPDRNGDTDQQRYPHPLFSCTLYTDLNGHADFYRNDLSSGALYRNPNGDTYLSALSARALYCHTN